LGALINFELAEPNHEAKVIADTAFMPGQGARADQPRSPSHRQ